MPLRARLVFSAVLANGFAAWGQVAFDSSAESTCDACDSLTYPLTVGTQPDRALVVTITDGCDTHSSSTDPVSAVSYGTASLTLASRTPCGTICVTYGGQTDSVYVEHWYLLSPDSGTDSVRITVPTANCGASNHYVLSGAISVSGVDQISPIRAAAGEAAQTVPAPDGGSVPTGVTVPSAPGDLLVDEVCNGTGVISPDTGATQQWLTDVNSASACNNHGGSIWTGAVGSVAVGWLVSQDIWVEQAISLAAARPDAGPLDAGADGGPPDAGADAGAPDAGPDSGQPSDAGTPGRPHLRVGCGCASTPATAAWLWVLALSSWCTCSGRRSVRR